MYLIIGFLIILCGTTESANYQRYGDNTQYSTYSTYSTAVNPYSQYPFKNGAGSFGSDVANFPGTRYPNFSPGYSTNKYDSYTTQRSNEFYPPGGYSTQRYGDSFSQGYGQNYGSGFGTGYTNGYSSYEMPFMKDIRGYCVNRSPQSGIWVDNLMGMWYGVEFVEHLAGDSRIDYTRTCIIVHIAEPVDQVSAY